MEIRFHGRGGQGAVTAAIMLAQAAWQDGVWSQKIPVYTGERRGVPVVAYLRLDNKPIRRISAIYEPDCVVVLDERLSKSPQVMDGLKDNGSAILNSRTPPEELNFGRKFSKLATIDATSITNNLFGVSPIPITNTTMLGAFSAAMGLVKLESVSKAIMDMLPADLRMINVEAAKEGYKQVKMKEVN